jgi:diguanylate cyclase (GGDEF)-like protein
MRTKLSEGQKFASLTFAPLLIVGVGLIWLTGNMLAGISDSVNKQEHERAWQAVQSAFAAEERRLASLLTDNAHWGDAVQNSYAPANEEWIKGMWGITTGGENYDVMMVLEPDGKVVSAYIHGEQVKLEAGAYIGEERLAKLLGDMPQDNATFEAVTSLVSTPDSPMIMAAGPIVPLEEEDVTVPAAKANLLILGQHITSHTLAFMGKQFIVDGLEFISLGDSLTGDGIMKDRWNNPVWRVQWQDRNPGEAARRNHRSSAFLLLFGLLALVLPISALHFATTRKLSRNRQRAQHLARHDSLTGLGNRSMLFEELEAALAEEGAPCTLLYIDLDGFKTVNDAYGHHTGDQLLCAIAGGLATLAGRHRLVRLGGDEFAILVDGSECSAEAERLARLILGFVREPFDINGRSALVGASLGLALREPGVGPVELMRRADIAMYDAKESGGEDWRWFDPKLDEKRLAAFRVAQQLRGIISRGEMEVAYQPIINADSRAIVGVEALARWPAGHGRLLSPAEFIPVAEEHGLINELGLAVARKACRAFAQHSGIRVAINVSPVQLDESAFGQSLMQVAVEEGLDPERLEVEFTESVLVRNPQRAREAIEDLRGSGIKVSLDDFGAGYASVGYLRTFQFDRIKLDRSLTQSVLKDISTQQVVQGTVLIARGLSMDIIAEGIESEEEARIMRLAGCHELQGYHFSKPRSAEEIRQRWLANTAAEKSSGIAPLAACLA